MVYHHLHEQCLPEYIVPMRTLCKDVTTWSVYVYFVLLVGTFTRCLKAVCLPKCVYMSICGCLSQSQCAESADEGVYIRFTKKLSARS